MTAGERLQPTPKEPVVHDEEPGPGCHCGVNRRLARVHRDRESKEATRVGYLESVEGSGVVRGSLNP
jgi:hypothetical protein